jgi:hypothetical protein
VSETAVDSAVVRMERLAAVLRDAPLRFGSEHLLQDSIESAFMAAVLDSKREVVLTPKDRIDFMVGDIGVEVKIGGTLNDVLRQLHRYAASEKVAGLLLVTSRLVLARLPPDFDGKPVRSVYVGSPF